MKNLKDTEGGYISTNSFISTTIDRLLATAFGGDGAQRPDLKPVLFEILINEFDSEHEFQPYADIRKESNFGDAEGEILLSLNTIMRVESVELDEPMVKVRLRIVSHDDPIWRNLKMKIPSQPLLFSIHETLSLVYLVRFLVASDLEKAEQLLSMVKPSNDPFSKLAEVLSTLIKAIPRTPLSDPSDEAVYDSINALQKFSSSIQNCFPHLSERFLSPLTLHIQSGLNLIQMVYSNGPTSHIMKTVLNRNSESHERNEKLDDLVTTLSTGSSLVCSTYKYKSVYEYFLFSSYLHSIVIDSLD